MRWDEQGRDSSPPRLTATQKQSARPTTAAWQGSRQNWLRLPQIPKRSESATQAFASDSGVRYLPLPFTRWISPWVEGGVAASLEWNAAQVEGLPGRRRPKSGGRRRRRPAPSSPPSAKAVRRRSLPGHHTKCSRDSAPLKMPCSAVTLSLATITAVVSTALLAIAFGTDNWVHIEVKRAQIQVRISRPEDGGRRPALPRAATWAHGSTDGQRRRCAGAAFSVQVQWSSDSCFALPCWCNTRRSSTNQSVLLLSALGLHICPAKTSKVSGDQVLELRWRPWRHEPPVRPAADTFYSDVGFISLCSRQALPRLSARIAWDRNNEALRLRNVDIFPQIAC